MNLTSLLLAFVLAAVAAALATRALVGWLTVRALDLPNARSMHTQPTPRGGGLVFAAIVLAMHAALLLQGRLPAAGWWWWLAAAAFAALGWMDDLRPRSVGLRLALQGLIASVFVLGFAAPFAVLYPAWAALTVLAIVAVIWAVNATNFIDGADGYCASQAMAQALAGAALLLAREEGAAALLACTLAGACGGFLVWNKPRARVFMGDVGSYFLGFEFAAFALYGGSTGGSPWVWLILGTPVIADATLTLLRRMLRGEALTSAHRTHAYQQLLLGGWSPRQLLVALVASNALAWWPLAVLAERKLLAPPAAALLAYSLAGIMWYFATRRAARS